MTFYTPPAVLSALGLTTYEPAAGSGYFLINPPFAMTESPPNTLCHTVYADRIAGLIITAWPCPVRSGSWLVRFRRRDSRRNLLNQVADWHPVSGWDRHLWPPGRARLVPPAALAAVEAWLVDRAAVEGPPAVTISALLHPAYEPGDGSADCAQMVGLAWWNPVMGCDSLQIVVDNARNILRSRWGHPAAPAAPETPAEALAARPLLEQVARLGDCIGANTVAQIIAISSRAAAWLEENPPGQPVAIEPRGCPTPGACSCVEPAAPAASELGET